MPLQSAHRSDTKSSIGLIESYVRTKDAAPELRLAYGEIHELYKAARRTTELPKDPAHIDAYHHEVAMREMAAPTVDYYRHYFNTCASQLQGFEDSGEFPRAAAVCVEYAFMRFESGQHPDDIREEVVAHWIALLRTLPHS